MNLNKNNDQGQFLDYLNHWVAGLPVVGFVELCTQPTKAAIICVDMINGFCHAGPLASPRVKQIIQPILALLKGGHRGGITQILLTQDSHEPEAVEFGAFPPHCIRGTSEAETIPEIKQLPFHPEMVLLEKNSIHSGLNTGLNAWLAQHPELDTFILVGDCTDLCIYQLAMHLRLDANAHQLNRRVVVPADCVDTYDIGMDAATAIGAMPHPGDILHKIFLYHMALNAIEIVATIQMKNEVSNELI